MGNKDDKDKIDVPDEFDLKNELDFTDTGVLHGELTRKLNILADISKLERQIEDRKSEDPETLGDESAIKTYEFVKTRVGLKKLVLDRFRKK